MRSKNNFPHIHLGRILIATTILVTVLVLLLIKENENRKKNPWVYKIQSEGASNAWEEFKKTQNGLSPQIQHANAHEFGEILYQTNGITGIEACDDSFNYGCYHSIVGLAIGDKGKAVLKKINSYCVMLGGMGTVSCQHGIGHGIMGTTKYTIQDLLVALRECDAIDPQKHILGCTNGALMEYNFATLHNGKTKVRQFDKTNPLYPCNSIPEEFIPSCYFSLPQWWGEVAHLKSQEIYPYIGQVCGSLAKDEKKYCGLGAGVVAPRYSEWKTQIILSNCMRLDDKELEIYCRAALENFPGRKAPSIYCDTLASEDGTICKNFRFL